ncbi:uncharacterized protein TNCT_96921 [Trichonephila clavata]|uniref:Polyprotein n=1 Tax=Trichonephila clavata TaxID=2740835 RepID=A0A8X6IJI7_TRICU|nr:uncharacterized protein TNCT_96921 [Trichonephila clavata]
MGEASSDRGVNYVLPQQTNPYNCGMKDCVIKTRLMFKDTLRKYQIKSDVKDSQICYGCCYGKQCRHPFGTRKQRATTPGELINIDVCGPMQRQSLGGAKYYLCFKDDFTKYRMVFLCSPRMKFPSALKHFLMKQKVLGI